MEFGLNIRTGQRQYLWGCAFCSVEHSYYKFIVGQINCLRVQSRLGYNERLGTLMLPLNSKKTKTMPQKPKEQASDYQVEMQPKAPICLKVDPGILQWLNSDDRRENTVLLDFDADGDSDGNLRLDLNVIFKPLAVRRGTATRADYYVGSTGAEVSLQAFSGSVVDYTPSATINVDYSNATTRTRSHSLQITPSVKHKRSDGGGGGLLSLVRLSTATSQKEYLRLRSCVRNVI